MAEAEKPRICFITTPGEITQLEDRYGDPREIAPDLNQIAKVDVVRLDQPLWEVATNPILETVHSLYDDYDAFVVTGQKDGLQFLAPRLAFAFGPNLDKTVVVTGCNIPAAFVHSGASERLVRAAMVAATPFKEVVIAFESSVVRGTSFQIGPHGSLNLLAYDSYYQPYGHLGEIIGIGVEINHLRKPQSGVINFLSDFENNIVSVGINPGTEPELVEPATVNRAGVIFSVDGKSLPSQHPYSFLPLVMGLSLKGIPVLVASRVRDTTAEDQTRYEGESVIEQLGGIVVRNMNLMVAVTKFTWVLRRVAEEIAAGKIAEVGKVSRVKEWMNKSLRGRIWSK